MERRLTPTLRQQPVRQLLAAALAVSAAMLLWPRPSFAACSDTWDPLIKTACSVDGFQYGLYKDLAGTLWWLDRLLLNASYALDSIRWWLIEVAFSSIYSAVTTVISPLLAPFAAFAIVLALVIIVAVPLTGVENPLNIRLILLWAVLGPTLLVVAGPAFIEVERVRSGIGLTFFSVAQNVLGEGAGAPDLGAGASVAGDPPPKMVQIYPGSLDTMTFNCEPHKALPESRYRGGQREDALTVLERTARFLWADARDIHCPSDPYPSAFAYDAPDGPHYVDDAAIDSEVGAERQEAIRRMNWGVTRLAIGLLPAIVCVLYYVVQIIFTLAMVLVWVAFPLGMIAGIFQSNFAWAAILIQRAGRIVATSWTVSLLLGVFVAMLGAAADSAATFAGVMIGLGVCLVMVFGSAVQTLQDGLGALSGAAGGVGLDPTAGVRTAAKLAGGAAGLAVGAASGGASMALTGAAALRQTGSGRYAMAAALGRSGTLANVGMLGAALGVVDEEVAGGLYAGYRSRKSPAGLKTMSQDANRSLADGTTIRQRAEDRETKRRVERATRGSLVDREIRTVANATRAAGRAIRGVADAGVVANDLVGAGLVAAEDATRVAWHGVRRGGSAVVQAGAQAVRDPGALARAGAQTAAQGARGAATAVAEIDRRAGERQRGTMTLDDGGRVLIGARVDDADLPQDALTEQLPAAQVSRLLNTQHTVQRNDDGTVTYWKVPAAEATPAATPRSIPRERAANDYARARQAARSNAMRFRRQAVALQAMDDPDNPSPELQQRIGLAEAKAVKQDRAARLGAPERPAGAPTLDERDQRRAAYQAAQREVLAESGGTQVTVAMRNRARIRANGNLPEHLRIGQGARPQPARGGRSSDQAGRPTQRPTRGGARGAGSTAGSDRPQRRSS